MNGAECSVGNVQQLLPESWRSRYAKAMVAIYRVARVPRQEFGITPYVFDIDEVRAAVFWGCLKIPGIEDEVSLTETGEISFAWRHRGNMSLAEGTYCLLAARMPNEASEGTARSAIEAARGVLCAYHGRNVAYDRATEMMLNLSEPEEITMVGRSIENPLALPVPRLRKEDRARFEGLLNGLSQANACLQNRLHLSFRWFSSAIEHSGPDAFLQYWIALEALAMPGSSDIAPINQHLAESYGVSVAKAKQRFLVGKLFGLRSNIVHGGHLHAVHGNILSYIAAVYTDVLLQVLNLPAERRAESELAELGPEPEQLFRQDQHRSDKGTGKRS